MTRAEARFWAKVEKSDTCWLWTGARNQRGYGNVRIDRAYRHAHRVSYEWDNGAIPPGMVVRHRCDTPSCVNPAHLEIGTQRDNIADAVRRGRLNTAGLELGRTGQARAAATSCSNGHDYVDGSWRTTGTGHRMCLVCRAASTARYRAKLRSAA